MIIDTHVHITGGIQGLTGSGPTKSLTYGRAQLGDDKFQMLPPFNPGPTVFEPENLLRFMDETGVDKAVLLQGSFYGDQNEYLHRAATRWPNRLIPAAFLDPRVDDARQTFHRAFDEYGFTILKFEMSELAGFTGVYPDIRLDEEDMGWIWKECEGRNIVVTLDLGQIGTSAYQTEAVEFILQNHPSLKIVIAHLAQPPLANAQDADLECAWEKQILLGRHANVWFDTAALPAYGDDDYPFATALKYVRRAGELIGIEKLMWGTDIPGLFGKSTYQQMLDMYRRHSGFSEVNLRQFLGETAVRVYDLPAGIRTGNCDQAKHVTASCTDQQLNEPHRGTPSA